MLERYLASHEGGVEAIGGAGGGNDRHGALAVAAKECLQQVSLLRLGGQAGGWASALHVEHHQRQLHDDGQVHGFALEAHSGA